jgi:hypothetical protein
MVRYGPVTKTNSFCKKDGAKAPENQIKTKAEKYELQSIYRRK